MNWMNIIIGLILGTAAYCLVVIWGRAIIRAANYRKAIDHIFEDELGRDEQL